MPSFNLDPRLTLPGALSQGDGSVSAGELNQNRGPELIAIYCSLAAISIIVVTVRIYARYHIHALGLDDWLMLFSLLLAVVATALAIVIAENGGFKHIETLSPTQTFKIFKVGAIWQPFGINSFGFSKASIGWMILRIFGPSKTTWQKPAVWFFSVTTPLATLITTILEFAQCNPPRAVWTSGLAGAKCWPAHIQENYSIFSGVWSGFADLAFVFILMSIVIKLNLSRRKRTTLMLVFSLGIFTAICAFVKIAIIQIDTNENHPDSTWLSFYGYAWHAAEMFLCIILGSLPPIIPLFTREPKGSTSYPLESTFNRKKESRTSKSKGADTLIMEEADEVVLIDGSDKR